MTSYNPVRLAYNTFEPASGVDASLSPVLFLHGLTVSKEYWKNIPQIVANETKRKVYTLDSRNHGDSEWADVFSFDANVDDLFHFMDSMNISKAVLIGHSMGGRTSIEAALRKPERVEKLIVEDMIVGNVPKFLHDKSIFYISLAQRAVKSVPPDLDMDGAVRFISNYMYKDTPDDIKKGLKLDQPRSRNLVLKRSANGHYAFKADLQTIEKGMRNLESGMSEPEGVYNGPACFIYGKNSPFYVLSEENHVKNFFPKAELIGIEGAAHEVHTDTPEEFIEAVLKFLC